MTGNSAKTARQSQFEREGVAIVEHALTDDELVALDRLVPKCNDREAGFHVGSDVLDHISRHAALSSLAAEFCPAPSDAQSMRLLRVIFFDKHEGVNWFVPWHQDQVREPLEPAGMGAQRSATSGDTGAVYSAAGVRCKTQTPLHLLNKIVTLRVHLDDCTEDDGPIEVVPGSHRHGVMRSAQILDVVAKRTPQLCLTVRGDILVMRPLLVHRSQRARRPSRRRVLHLEYLPETVFGLPVSPTELLQ
ncbi:MAG: phytanoyl-CoA dioxygenase family protein [Pseudomonadota bacterium]